MPYPHVLYIDNDFVTKKRAVILLFSNGLEVLPVSNIKEAVALIRVVHVDLIICDMHLPDGDGDHLLQTVKSSAELKHIPVIIVSARWHDAERQHVLKLGAASYMLKDEEANKYTRVVKDTVNTHRGGPRNTAGGISGQLAKMKIVDLISHLATEHGSGRISIDGKIPMEIHLRDGEIVHARHGITVGRKALFRCLRIAEAAFHFETADHPLDPSIRGGMTELLDEARRTNEELMANYHRLPNINHRVRILNSNDLQKTNLKPEARAALQIFRKYPRIGSYLDRLNLPDMDCYAYLMTFLERGFLELVTEKKPVKIITDGSCDLPSECGDVEIITLPLELELGGDRYRSIGDGALFYRRKPKHLEAGRIVHPDRTRILDTYRDLIPEYDCLTLVGPGSFFNHLQQPMTDLHQEGLGGKGLLAHELTTINSHSLSIGLGLLVKYALKLAGKNLDIEVIEEKLIQCIARQHLIFLVHPDKSFLVKKGSTPVLIYFDGEQFQLVSRLARGDDPLDVMIHEVHKRMDRKAGIHVAVGHVRDGARAETLARNLSEQLGLQKMPVVAIDSVNGYQFGEGALGITFFQE